MNDQIRTLAKKLLAEEKVTAVLGWEKGFPWFKRAPLFAMTEEECDALVFDEFCYHNLPKMLLRNEDIKGTVAVFVKGCDSRALKTMLQDHQLERENLYIIGLPCVGMKEEPAVGTAEGTPLADAKKCAFCVVPNAVIYDEFLGQPAAERTPQPDEELQRVEAMTQDEKYAFWHGAFAQCIRCFGCRNICPVCSCRECCFDDQSIWLDKGEEITDNSFYHLTRAMHMAGRCVECGECQRVCPQGLPVMLLNRKLNREIETLFPEEAAAGTSDESQGALKTFRLDDPEEFM